MEHSDMRLGKLMRRELSEIIISRWEHLIYQLGGHGEIIAYVIKRGRVEVEGGRLRGHHSK